MKTARKARKKTRKHVRPEKARGKPSSKASGVKEAPVSPPPIADAPAPVNELGLREGAGFKVSVDKIEGQTTIGDLIVVFPRTREVLLKHGLKLDVEDAGDIYMTLDAFVALHGLNTETLIRELVEASQQPPQQQPQQVPQIAAPPSAQ